MSNCRQGTRTKLAWFTPTKFRRSVFLSRVLQPFPQLKTENSIGVQCTLTRSAHPTPMAKTDMQNVLGISVVFGNCGEKTSLQHPCVCSTRQILCLADAEKKKKKIVRKPCRLDHERRSAKKTRNFEAVHRFALSSQLFL